MYRDEKFYEEKKIRKLYEEYNNSWKKRRESGHFEDVEPYQRGWNRTYTLRDDIKNRKDAQDIRQALDLINSTQFSRNKEFTYYSWKQRKDLPIPQPLHEITEKKYDELNEKLKSFFQPVLRFNKRLNTAYTMYAFKHPYYFVFNVKPNMIVARWVPDEQFESRMKELSNKISTHNLWPKIRKVYHWKSDDWLDWVTPLWKTKENLTFEESQLDYIESDEEES